MLLGKTKEPTFSQPIRQIVIMLLVLALVVTGAILAYQAVLPIFSAAPYLNGLIVGVFVIGVIACFWQVLTLVSAVNWIEGFALDRPGHEFVEPPKLLAPLAALLSSKSARKALTSFSTRSILDSVAVRLDEARDVTRYIVNLLIFLGLLGTFWGLATTVPAVVETIRSLAPREGAGGLEVFNDLMNGLEKQLGGMGTAFASSLLGLAGSLIVGLLELFAGHGQNRFYGELEDWLSSITRISLRAEEGEASPIDGTAVLALMEENATQIEVMREGLERLSEQQQATEDKLSRLLLALDGVSARLAEDRNADRFSKTNQALEQLVAQNSALVEQVERANLLDGQNTDRLDQKLVDIVEELRRSSDGQTKQIHADLAELTRVIRIAAELGE